MFDDEIETTDVGYETKRGERLTPLVPVPSDINAARFGEFVADLMARGVYTVRRES